MWCSDCETKLIVGGKEFKASFILEKPYPGLPKKETGVIVVERKPGDVIDLSEYMKNRKQGPPS